MCAKMLPLLLFLLLPTQKKAASGESTPVVEVDPKPLNVSVNALATFSCVVEDAELVLWYANSSNLDNINGFIDTHTLEPTNTSNILRYNISFFVYESFEALLDDSDIKCVGVDFQPNYVMTESSEVKLRVQGLLDPPTDISAEIINGVVNITWKDPFSLDKIKIYDYYVNVTAYNSSGIIEYMENITTVLNFTFPLIDQSACTVYSSSIQARSDAGLGHAGMADMVNTFEVPKWLKASQIAAQVIFTGDDIILQFTIEQDNCIGQQADSIAAEVYYNTDLILTNAIPAEANGDGSISIQASVPNSVQGTEVIAIITLMNRMGSSKSEPKLISIASTEKVIFSEAGSISGVSFQCLFAELSHPNGCYVVFECMSNQGTENLFKLSIQDDSYISETGFITCTLGSCSTYEIHAYDIANDGSEGVLAWSETNKTLCPSSKDTSASYSYSSPYMYSTPTISSTPGPTISDGWLLGMWIVLGVVNVMLFTTVAVSVIRICRKCRKHKAHKELMLQEIRIREQLQSSDQGNWRSWHQ